MKKENNNIEEEKNNKIVINKRMIICTIYLGLFIILSILVFTKVTNPLDDIVASFAIGIRNDKLTKIMRLFTNISSSYSLIVITILITLIAFIKHKRLPINTIINIINLISVFLLSQLFKLIFRRPRPTGEFLTNASGFSYPSGHTMVSFAFFTFIAYALSERLNNKLLKLIIKIGTPILILLIGFSRIYLGVHYLTDIIAGYLMGMAYLMIFLTIREKNKKKKKMIK